MAQRRRSATELTDKERALVAPLFPSAKPGGRPRTTDVREVLNALSSRAAKARALGIPELRGVQATAAVMVAEGIALALDVFPRAAAAVLAASLVPTTVIGHAFWTEQTPVGRHAQQMRFLKNRAMLAALLLILQGPCARHECAT